jgi:TatA/E family protein of Tat protein translocase
MFNLDPAKLLVIAVVAVLLLGPDKLPHVARQAGGAWKSFNDFRQRMEAEVRSNIPDLPSTGDLARMTKSPTALFDHLEKMGGPSSSATRDLSGSNQATVAPIETLGASPEAEMEWVTPDYSETDMVVSPLARPRRTEAVSFGDANLN